MSNTLKVFQSVPAKSRDRKNSALPRNRAVTPSDSMSATRRMIARRNNQLISQMNLVARIETASDGWYY